MEEERETGRSLSEQNVLTDVQEDEDAARSPADIILPTIPLRDETEEGRLVAAWRHRDNSQSIKNTDVLFLNSTIFHLFVKVDLTICKKLND